MEPETVDLLSESGDAVEAHEDWNQVEFPEACTFDVASLLHLCLVEMTMGIHGACSEKSR